MSSILAVGRSILACLQPLTGERATGTCVFNCTGSASVPAYTFLSPVLNGQYRPDMAFKVPLNPATLVLGKNGLPATGGDWPIVGSGNVPVISNIGGSRFNVPAGTVFRIEPDVGDTISGTCGAATNFTGGTDLPASALASEADLSIYNAVMYETFSGGTDATEALFNSNMGNKYPAVLLTWTGDEPADGMATNDTSRPTKRGSGAMQYAMDFDLWIVCSRLDSESARRGQAARLLDEAAFMVYDRMSVDGLVFSSPGGLHIKRRYRVNGNGEQFFKTFRVYGMTLSATVTQSKQDERTPAPLVRFVADYLRQDDTAEDLPMLHNEQYLASPGVVAFTLPANNASYARGLTALVHGTMPYADATLSLTLDGAPVVPTVTGTAWVYKWAIPGGAALGAHAFQATAVNDNGTQTTANLSLTVTP